MATPYRPPMYPNVQPPNLKQPFYGGFSQPAQHDVHSAQPAFEQTATGLGSTNDIMAHHPKNRLAAAISFYCTSFFVVMSVVCMVLLTVGLANTHHLTPSGSATDDRRSFFYFEGFDENDNEELTRQSAMGARAADMLVYKVMPLIGVALGCALSILAGNYLRGVLSLIFLLTTWANLCYTLSFYAMVHASNHGSTWNNDEDVSIEFHATGPGMCMLLGVLFNIANCSLFGNLHLFALIPNIVLEMFRYPTQSECERNSKGEAVDRQVEPNKLA